MADGATTTSTSKLPVRMTTAAFLARDLPDGERWELIDGRPVLSPSPDWEHQEIAGRVYARFDIGGFLPTDAQLLCVPAPADVVLPGGDVVQPDVVVIRAADRPGRGERFHGVPALVVEVLSPSNAAHDLETKYALYRAAGIAEYWIIDPDAQTLTIHILHADAYVAAPPAADGFAHSPTLDRRVRTAVREGRLDLESA
jgi:Uma2 family endonuclease